MTFGARYYSYAVTHEGVKEFLHTHLDKPGAISFIQKHQSLFGSRYEKYLYMTLSEGVEHYVG